MPSKTNLQNVKNKIEMAHQNIRKWDLLKAMHSSIAFESFNGSIKYYTNQNWTAIKSQVQYAYVL